MTKERIVKPNKTMQCETPGCTNEKYGEREDCTSCTECKRKRANKNSANYRKRYPNYYKNWYAEFKEEHGVSPSGYRALNLQKQAMVRAELAKMGLLK